MDYTIIGNEVNLAARLQTHADLGGILLAHETYALVHDRATAEEWPAIEVKGIRREDSSVRTDRVPRRTRRRPDDHVELEGMSVRIDLHNLDDERRREMLAQLAGSAKRLNSQPHP